MTGLICMEELRHSLGKNWYQPLIKIGSTSHSPALCLAFLLSPLLELARAMLLPVVLIAVKASSQKPP